MYISEQLQQYEQLLTRLFVAISKYEAIKALEQPLSAAEISRFADRDPMGLSPLEREIQEAVLELEKLRIQLLTENNRCGQILDQMLQNVRRRFSQSSLI